MATTTPDNLRTPNPGDPYNLVADLAILAQDVQDALNTKESNLFKGTSAQRVSFTSTATNGMLWQDTDGIKMIWRKDGANWVPAVWRWSGTTTQMNAFTQAPNGFEWRDSTANKDYIRVGGAWRPKVNVVQATTTTYLSTASTSFQATALSASITPASTSSKVLVTATFVLGTTAAGGNGYATLFRGGVSGVNLGNGLTGMVQAWAGSSTFRTSLTISFLDSPGTASSQLYTIGVRSVAGTVDFIPAGTLATIVLTEVP